MALFSLKKPTERVGVIIDIGSGSVLVAIVRSHPLEQKPEIIWSHREQAPLRNIDSLEQSAKSVMTSLVNALLRLDGDGRRVLREYSAYATIEEVQCCICAPWAYTVSKTISYTKDEPFAVTKSLISELIGSAEKTIQAELSENETARTLGLTVITRSTLDVLANGYRILNAPEGNATDLSLSQVSVVTQQYLVEQLHDLRHKMFAEKPMHTLSYMLALYSVTDELFAETGDYGLIDITYEATEIGIVRDGVLRYSTHTPFGSFSLAREIANVTSHPLLQAFQLLHEDDSLHFLETVPMPQKVEIEAIFAAYVARLESLFKETGDELSIPKRLYIHTDKEMESLFSNLVTQAVSKTTKTTPSIKHLSSSLRDLVSVHNRHDTSDTAMLVAAKFFHTQNARRHFEYI